MLSDARGAEDATGATVKVYKAGELIGGDEFSDGLGMTFMQAGLAEEVKVVEPTETKATGKRARNEKGHYIADDPETPDVNEAYVGGKAPAKKTTKKKSTAKKSTKKKS